MITLKELQNKVEKNISNYIEFDVNEIFKVSEYITIYGGAVRDGLADMEIHDVDILCMPYSAVILRDFIKKYNYEPIDLCKSGSFEIYKNISIISEPWTFINNNKKIIQIIRPKYPYNPKIHTPTYNDYFRNAYYDLIKNVDISCCGVFLEGTDKVILKEACKEGIVHCLTKTFEINNWANLYNSIRTTNREYKLKERGWRNINDDEHFPFSITKNDKNKNKIDRLIKLKKLEINFEYDYKIW